MEATMFAFTTVPQAAKMLHLSERMVRVLAKSGKLKGVQIGGTWVFDPGDVERLARERSAEKSRRVG